MDHHHPRSASGNGEDNVGIPDDLRCKRSDGKQWRCTAMSMPDKTVCEKHYIQAKKRAANSAMRASLKKAKRKSMGETDVYLESKSDDFDVGPANERAEEEYPLLPVSGKKYSERASKDHFDYSPETTPVRSFSLRNPPRLNDSSPLDLVQYEENWRSHRTASPVSGLDGPRNRSQRSFDANAMTVSEYSDQSTESCEETESGGQTCHQCRRSDKEDVIWCLKCDRRGYCDDCISSCYPDISEQDIQRLCPACRGTCNCKICLRGDNLLKVRIKEIPALDKLMYLHRLLSSVLPIVKQIHHDQCFEVELEKRLRGTEIDLTRTRLNADEQMCCNFCRISITDYHRHCANCSYDLCLSCSRDLREASMTIVGKSLENETTREARFKLNFSDKFPEWKGNNDGSIPCPPKEYGGCGYPSLNLSRIFKMNWVAKLVKNVEEMVSGCSIYDDGSSIEKIDPRTQHHTLEIGNGRFLYCPASEDFKSDGIGEFRKHWARGEPIIVKKVFDSSSLSSWDPMEIWRGIQETTNEKSKDENEIVKAIDYFNWSEVYIELGEFMKGYFEGRIDENGEPEMLKLKDWPSPSGSEEFLLYQRPEFISKLPLLEYIHSKWGLLNVAAKLPHYSLQNDVGPKIFISYGTHEELVMGNSVTNLHANIRDMVYLLVHTCEPKLYGQERIDIMKESELKDSEIDQNLPLDDDRTPDLSLGDDNSEKEYGGSLDLDENKDETMIDRVVENTTSVEMDAISCEQQSNPDGENVSEKTRPGVIWDVFHRRDVSKVVEYLRVHQDEFETYTESYDVVTRPLYDERIFLNGHHKKQLKEEYGVEPWSFEQHLGQAVFVPAGCPFQVRNLQSTVQLGLDFLSPESLGDAAKMAEEIRCLPNDHEAKLQVLEVGKISLYAASSAIKEVQKLVLDPKLGAELGFEDPNLTASVTENLEKMTKRRQISCA